MDCAVDVQMDVITLFGVMLRQVINTGKLGL